MSEFVGLLHYSDTYSKIISVRKPWVRIMKKIIGRKNEQIELEDIYSSKKPEFVLVYGRRRIGKTFLVKNFFLRKSGVFFNVTGIKDGALTEQLTEFAKAISKCFYHGANIAVPNSWMQAFEELSKAISNCNKRQKIVLFMDEFPWMATKKSRLIQALEYYWNQYWLDNTHLKLIICGSSAAWIVKKILYQKGGLHNRVTRQIILKSFNLLETKQFLEENNIKLNPASTIQLYLVFGGVPFYLEQFKRNQSVASNINNLCFKENSILFNEFNKLFQSLFDDYNDYSSLVKIISRVREGISRSEVESKSKTFGGRLTERLKDLETAGFIKSFLPIMDHKYGTYYKLFDEFCYFYLKWIEPEQFTLLSLVPDHNYWNQVIKSASYRAWSGYSFEMLCYKHISFIKKELDILDDARVGTWRYDAKKNTDEEGAQIDLLFDQSDSIVLCEIKYTEKDFSIDKSYAEDLSKKIDIFKKITKTKKPVFLALISANQIKENRYSKNLVSRAVIIENLLK